MTHFLAFTVRDTDGKELPAYIRTDSVNIITDCIHDGYCQLIISGFGPVDVKGTRHKVLGDIELYSTAK